MKAKPSQLLRWLLFALLLAGSHAANAFYDPTPGRWINRDPIQEWGLLNGY